MLLPLLMLVPLLASLLPVELPLSGFALLLDSLPLLMPLLFVLPLPVVLLLSVVPPFPLVLLSVEPLLAPLLSLEPLLFVPLLSIVPLLLPVPLLSVALLLLLPLDPSCIVSRVGSLEPLLLLCVSPPISFPNAGTMLAIADAAAAAEINCLTFMLTSKKKLITPAS